MIIMLDAGTELELVLTLREFVRDCNTVGREFLVEDWPDLLATYDRALNVLDRVERKITSHVG